MKNLMNPSQDLDTAYSHETTLQEAGQILLRSDCLERRLPEVEAFLRKINFPYTIAYGMTECAPLICHSRWDEIQYTSCGKTVANMETRVLSDDPTRIPGELVCRGMNTMLGYYKNEKATEETMGYWEK